MKNCGQQHFSLFIFNLAGNPGGDPLTCLTNFTVCVQRRESFSFRSGRPCEVFLRESLLKSSDVMTVTDFFSGVFSKGYIRLGRRAPRPTVYAPGLQSNPWLQAARPPAVRFLPRRQPPPEAQYPGLSTEFLPIP